MVGEGASVVECMIAVAIAIGDRVDAKTSLKSNIEKLRAYYQIALANRNPLPARSAYPSPG
jgi:hypothetical protein